MNQRHTVLDVAGMSCESCVRHVTAALQAVPGVSAVSVELRAGTAEVRHAETASVAALQAAVRDAGYDAAVRQ